MLAIVQRLRLKLAAVACVLFANSVAKADDNPHTRHGTGQGPAGQSHVEGTAVESGGGGSTVVTAKSEVSAYADTDAVSVFTPALEGAIKDPLSGWSAAGSYLVDIVSAASVDIVSTASGHWTELRHAGSLNGTYKPGAFGVTASGSVSREPDYLSLSGGGALSLELAQKTANPRLGYTYTSDKAGRVGTPFSVYVQPLTRHTFNGSMELILDPLTLISFGVDGIFESGDQSKPYRYVPLFRPGDVSLVPPGASIDLVNTLRLPGRVNERLPDKRNRIAVSVRVAQRLSGSTLILSERLYADSWGLKASTTDLRFVADVSRRLFLWTHLRGHIQGAVSFWKRAYAANFNEPTAAGIFSVPALRTGDREEGPLSAATFGAGARWNVGPATRLNAWSLVLQADMFTTFFSDALFIQSREGYLGVFQVEGEF
jgi:hypothetical protein